jgi:Lrp/AsnC family transcriptional regulator, leucine-responsive regulatory protein
MCRNGRQNAGWTKAMDDKDRLLITLLRKDARQPIVSLARDLGLSRSATQDRLAKLVASGAVSRFTIVEGAQAEGRQTAHFLVSLEKGFRCAQIVPKLRKLSAATVIHSIAGPHDILVRADAADMTSIEAARAAIAATPGVADVTTLVTLERHSG